MIRKIVIFIITSGLIYLVIATGLIIIGKPTASEKKQDASDYASLLIDYSQIPHLQSFTTRGGDTLQYRRYPASTDKVLILIHGSGWHSRYLMTLARFISSQGLAQVYTPDLRGHGDHPERRGDVDYIGQLEDDLADLIALIKKQNPSARLILGGHSSGGGLAVRMAGSGYGSQIEAYLLLSPYLGHDAPSTRPASGGWASPNIPRIIGLVMLNQVGITWFNHLEVIKFNMPATVRDGSETLIYSFRLNTSYAPRGYAKDLSKITQPLLLMAGARDKSFYAQEYEPLISKYSSGRVKVVEGVDHMGVVTSKAVMTSIKNWLENLAL